MHYYPKILAPFNRVNVNDRLVDIDSWSRPEFELLKSVKFKWTEKVDGTSVCIHWDGDKVQFHGHTDKSQFSPRYLRYLTDKFGTPDAETLFEQLYGSTEVMVFGEGISKDYNCHYGYPEGNFIIYDIYNPVTKSWWSQDAIDQFATVFNLITVPFVFEGTIMEAVAKVMECPKSMLNSGYYMEGLVGRTDPVLKFNNGDRIITKVKCRDYLAKEELKK